MGSKISLSTNVDLQNYADRIDKIAQAMKPLGIEIFSLPQNYAPKLMLELPETGQPYEGKFTVLSRTVAREIGRKMRENGIAQIQYHYPWQKTLLDMDGHDFALTVQFCDMIADEAKAEKFTINHHNVLKYPTPSAVRLLNGGYRKEIHRMLDTEAKFAQIIKGQFNSRCRLIVENNPAVSIDRDAKTGEDILDNVDLLAEDYADRPLDGTNLDYSHAWSVVGYFNQASYPGFRGEDRIEQNLEWCRRQYGGYVYSMMSIGNFVRKVAPFTEWVHLSDEPHPFTHSGSHMGDGNVDLEECAELLESNLDKETPATIEVKDGHTDAGFKRILEHDFPYLKRIFGG